MHTNQTLNLIAIESLDKFEIPQEVKEVTNNFSWEKMLWNCVGLPSFGSTFSVSSNRLYFEEDSNGKMNLHQEDFTGQCLVNGMVITEKSDKVFSLVYELTFCQGNLIKTELKECNANPREEYDAGFQAFVAHNKSMSKILSSWWCKWIYRPYYNIVKYSTIAIAFVVNFLLSCFISIMNFITPIKL